MLTQCELSCCAVGKLKVALLPEISFVYAVDELCACVCVCVCDSITVSL